MKNTNENMTKLSKIKLFALDMDGTIYLDTTPLDGAIDFCNKLYEKDMLCYFTNNSSKNPMDYVEKLNKIGFPAERRHIITSGDVTIAYLNKYHHRTFPRPWVAFLSFCGTFNGPFIFSSTPKSLLNSCKTSVIINRPLYAGVMEW